ncbi:hypothetical protein ACF08O_25910 [Streptomyces paradoxus]|uniref:hypothetical protein n=1 Tax=Streptomyces paradoxus TaxID=66375 RepID=UPI0036F81641
MSHVVRGAEDVELPLPTGRGETGERAAAIGPIAREGVDPEPSTRPRAVTSGPSTTYRYDDASELTGKNGSTTGWSCDELGKGDCRGERHYPYVRCGSTTARQALAPTTTNGVDTDSSANRRAPSTP